MSKRRVYLCLVLAATVLSSLSYAVTPDRITGTLSGQMVVLRGNVNRKALSQYDQGEVDAAMPMGTITLMTVSTPTQVKALTTLLEQQQTPGSPNYHKWLTPEQWADRFGLSRHDIQQITTWLAQQGFIMIHAARGRNWVSFTGTAAQVEAAFSTQIHHYSVRGELHYANASSPSVPAGITGIVAGFRGLDDFRPHPMGIQKKPSPHPMYYSSTWGDLIAPGDIATIYNFQTLINSGNDGTGYKLAVMGQTDVYLADLNDFRSGFGLPQISTSCGNSSGLLTSCTDAHFQYVLDGSDPGVSSGDLEEADLDLEWSAAVAQGAQLVFVNSTNVFTSYYYAIDNNLAPVISLSYGLCEFDDNQVLDPSTGQPAADELELMKANSEGITFVNSSGDSGAAECDNSQTVTSTGLATQGLAVSYPASSPQVTGVGGTAIPIADLTQTGGVNAGTYWGTTNGSTGGTVLASPGYIPEQNWNDDLEFYQFCQTDPSDGICVGSENGTGVSITSEATAQEVIGIGSDGGGASNCAKQNTTFSTCVSGFPQPSWQTVTISGQAAVRFSPDVSLLATPNFPGYIFCTPQSELGLVGTTSSCSPGGTAGITNALSLKNGQYYDPSIIGGTSASAPVFAGIVVLLNQYLSASGGLGNVNPMLYTLAASSPSAFHPVTTGDNNVSCEIGTPTDMPTAMQCPGSGVIGFSASNADATTHYNLVTGLGSVDVNQLAQAWSGSLTSFSLSATALSPTSVVAGNTTTTTVTMAPINNFSGTVTLSCPNAPEGITCTFNPTTVTSGSPTTQLTINTAVSTQAAPNGDTITITGTSGSTSESTTVSLIVTATNETFTLALVGGNPSVNQGAQVQPNISITGSNGFNPANSPLTITCTTTAPEARCIYPTNQIVSTSFSVQVTTTAPSAAANHLPNRGVKLFYAALLPGLLGILFTAGTRKRSLRGMRFLGLIVVLGFSTLWMASCSGSNNSSTGNSGTPVGSYSVTVTATTGGAAPVSNSVQFTLNVTAQ